MTLAADLSAESARRDDAGGWQREAVPVVTQHRNEHLLRPYKRAYCSSVVCTVLDTRQRWQLDGLTLPPGESARLYLRRTLNEAAEGLGERSIYHKRVPFRRDVFNNTRRKLPFYFWAGGQVNDTPRQWAIVDICHCFASIYLRVGLDPIYRPDGHRPLFGLGRAPFPAAAEWDAIPAPLDGLPAPRNALIGTCWHPRLSEWRHGEKVLNKVPNRFFAPDLSDLVADICHQIAHESRELFGAVSWAMDGGAVPLELADEWAAWLAARWSLTGEIRATGPGWIWSPISWRVGNRATEHTIRGEATTAEARDGIVPVTPRVADYLAGLLRGLARALPQDHAR